MTPWNRLWKWNPRWNVQQVPWSLKSKTLLPHQDLCSWLTGVCIASLLGLLIGSACSFLFLYLSTRKSAVTTSFIQAAVELWLHHQVNTSGFGYGCTLWWLFCQPGGGTNYFFLLLYLDPATCTFIAGFRTTTMFCPCSGWGCRWRCCVHRSDHVHPTLPWLPVILRVWLWKWTGPFQTLK